MKKLETFDEYIQRLLSCKNLRKDLREDAAKKLIKMYERRKDNPINQRIKFIKITRNPHLYEMFIWEKTKEGIEYWQEIADAGF